MSLPKVDDLNKLSESDRANALGLLFEPCATLVKLVMPLTSVRDYTTSWPVLIEQIRTTLHSLDYQDPRVSQIVAAHPRLGAKKVASAQSQAEQASLQVEAAEEAQLLADGNAKYEQTFPGLRYVVFVAGRPRSEILVDLHRRVKETNYKLEVARAFDAMCDIALDRQSKLDPPREHI